MLSAVTEVNEREREEEKTDPDVSGVRKAQEKSAEKSEDKDEEWGENEATLVDARPPEDPPGEPRKTR
jgi:hypothetical protein